MGKSANKAVGDFDNAAFGLDHFVRHCRFGLAACPGYFADLSRVEFDVLRSRSIAKLMEIFIFIISLLIMLVGIAGIFIPPIPGVPVVFLGALIYAVATGFAKVTVGTIILFGALAVLSFAFDSLAGLLGAKQFGATKWGIAGALLGALVGTIFAGLLGAIVGPIVGAIALEMIGGKEFQESLRAGIGVFIGFLLGTVANIILAATMITMFVKAAI